MRFSIASVAFFAGLAIAAPSPEETVYETQEVTITSCAPEVTDCPGATATYEVPEQPVYTVPTEPEYPTETSEAPVYPTETPEVPEYPTDVPEYPTESSAYPTESSTPVVPTYSSVPPPYPTPIYPSTSVITISTCIPTVTYSTITITPTPSPTGGVTPSYSYPPQGTSSVPPQFTGAASNVGGSVAFAGVAAALAAFLA